MAFDNGETPVQTSRLREDCHNERASVIGFVQTERQDAPERSGLGLGTLTHLRIVCQCGWRGIDGDSASASSASEH